MTILRAEFGDITTCDVQAIVNAANATLLGGGGVDGAIHEAGGPRILAECQGIVEQHGHCAPGNAVVTTGGNLPAKFVIHAVGPVWTPENIERHEATLADAYRNSLVLADQIGARTLAFPNISTGAYGFPKDRAARIATGTVHRFVAAGTSIESIVFVCFDHENLSLYLDRIGA